MKLLISLLLAVLIGFSSFAATAKKDRKAKTEKKLTEKKKSPGKEKKKKPKKELKPDRDSKARKEKTNAASPTSKKTDKAGKVSNKSRPSADRPVTAPLNKDGTPDMRYKANRDAAKKEAKK
jgi:hypothetical protein